MLQISKKLVYCSHYMFIFHLICNLDGCKKCWQGNVKPRIHDIDIWLTISTNLFANISQQQMYGVQKCVQFLTLNTQCQEGSTFFYTKHIITKIGYISVHWTPCVKNYNHFSTPNTQCQGIQQFLHTKPRFTKTGTLDTILGRRSNTSELKSNQILTICK